MNAITDLILAWLNLDSEWRWIGEVFLVVSAIVLINFLLRIVFFRLLVVSKRSDNNWDNTFIASVSAPIRLACWAVGLSIAGHLAFSRMEDETLLGLMTPLREVGVVIAIGWFLIRLVNNIGQLKIDEYHDSKGEQGIDPHTAEAMGKLLRMSIFITVVLVALQNVGVSISGVMAFGGVGGIAIGFAAKEMLSNFFGGLTIYLDKPFIIGDWIRSPDRSIEGTVEHIGWRRTIIRTFDKRPLYVPNQAFTSISVENPSRMSNRRIYETIGVRYDDAATVGKIIEDIKAMLRSHEAIDQNQTMIVNFNAFGPSSLDFFVYTFTKTTNWVEFHEIKHQVLLSIYEIIQSHDADVAFPTRRLLVESDDFPQTPVETAVDRNNDEPPRAMKSVAS